MLFSRNPYRWLVFLIVGALLVMSWAFMQFVDTPIQEQPVLGQESLEEGTTGTTFLLVFCAMAAGFPAVGMGTYLMYQGTQIRLTKPVPLPDSPEMLGTAGMEGSRAGTRGNLFIAGGGFVLISGLALPLIAWWISEHL